MSKRDKKEEAWTKKITDRQIDRQTVRETQRERLTYSQTNRLKVSTQLATMPTDCDCYDGSVADSTC